MAFYFSFLKVHFKMSIEYRGAFIMHIIAKIFGWGSDFLMLFVMISQVNKLNGYSPYEMLLLFGLQLFAYSLAGFFFYNLNENFDQYILRGDLDQVLTKPVNPLFFLICREFNTGYISNLIVAASAIIISFANLGIALDFQGVIYLLLTILGGALIFSGTMMLQIIPSFWTLKKGPMEDVDSMLQTMSRYPLTIFHKALQIVLTFIIPYAFVNYIPVQMFIRKDSFLKLPEEIMYLSLPIGLLFGVIVYSIWAYALKHYSSSGS